MFNRKAALGLIVVLLVGLVLFVFLSKQKTQTRQQASEIINLNTGSQITSTKNADGSMGPKTSKDNYSNSLSEKDLGSLTFSITDPVQGDSVLPTHIPTVTPSDGNQTSSQIAKGTQKVKSLIIKIRKVEVHLVQGKTILNRLDKWEVVKLDTPISLDLVQLVNGGLVNLGLTKLSAGKYEEVRVYVENASAILENGEVVNLNISDKEKIVRVIQDFEISVGKNTNLIMDFDAQHSVSYDGKNFILTPDVTKLLVNK